MIRIIHLGHGEKAAERFWALAAEQMRREGKPRLGWPDNAGSDILTNGDGLSEDGPVWWHGCDVGAISAGRLGISGGVSGAMGDE